MDKIQKSASYSVYTESNAGDAESGVCCTQAEGRTSLPPVQSVKTATPAPKGTVTTLAKQQTKDGVN